MPRRLVNVDSAAFWINRYGEHGKEYVSRIGYDNYEKQREIVIAAVQPHLRAYAHTLDFGCGVGRFQDFLWKHSEEVDAVDWVEGALSEVAAKNPNTKTICYDDLPLPLETGKYQLVWSCMVLQHIKNLTRFEETCKQLGDSTASGAKFVLIENASDVSEHVALRQPEEYADALGFSLDHREHLSIDKPHSHWLIVGTERSILSEK